MKQLIQSYRSGELWLAEVPAPAGRSGGAVVRTAASVVSAGTERMILELAKKSLIGKARARPDLVKKVIAKIRTEGLSAALEKVFAKLDTPIPLGYSCAGTVVESGAGAISFRPGDRVACGGAGYATHAELNYVPKNLMAKIPANVSFEDASFTTLGSIAMQGVRQADVRLGERVAVIGLGLVGLLTVQILHAAGCQVLGIDPDAHRRELSLQIGAEAVASDDVTEAANAFSDGQGIDAVIIAAATDSNQPIETAAEISRVRGRVVIVGMVGMNVPRDSFYKKELDLRLSMSYGPGRYDPSYEEGGHDYPIGYVRWTEHRNMQSFLHLLATGRVTPSKLVTHRYSIDGALAAYELLESRREPYLGILIDYPDRLPQPLEVRTIELRPVVAEQRIGIGLVGAGNFAKGVLIPTLKRHEGIEWAGVCTATGASGSQIAAKHGFAYATTDVERIMGDSKVNVVVIATRHDLHARLACRALEAGKHVFVEKPLCVRPEELSDFEEAISRTGGKCLMVGFNRRFSPHTDAIRQAFSGRGTPMVITYRVNAGMLPKDSWIADVDVGGGRIIGEVCHFVDWCEAVTDSVPVSVQAECVGGAQERARGEENLIATIRYQDGSVATIQYLALGPTDLGKERIEIFADGHAAVVEDFVTTTFVGGSHCNLRTRQDKGFDHEMAAFIRCVRGGGEMPIPFASLLRTTRVTFAIVESLGSGRPAELGLVGQP